MDPKTIRDALEKVILKYNLPALGELAGTLGVGGLDRRIGGIIAGRATPAQAGVGNDRSIHQLRFAEAILDQGLQRLLGGIDAAAIAVGDAPNADAVNDGIGLADGRGSPDTVSRPEVWGHNGKSGQGGCAGKK